MNRPIKFRQRVYGRFHYWGFIDDAFIGPVNPTDPSDQFTGLHDKNGREIYEGDIVKFETLDAINNQTLVGAIKYSEHGTRFGVEIEHRGLLQFYPNYTEVIGNIYEKGSEKEVDFGGSQNETSL